MPTERMDPPPGASPRVKPVGWKATPMRMTASWSGSHDPAVYKFVSRRYAPMASCPRILCRPAPTGARSYAKSPSQFIVAARAQASRRCETQALLSGKPLALLPFRSLDPFHAYREPDRRRRDEERGFPAPNKEPPTNQKHDLTGKAPYKVRIRFPPAKSQLRTYFRRYGRCDLTARARQGRSERDLGSGQVQGGHYGSSGS